MTRFRGHFSVKFRYIRSTKKYESLYLGSSRPFPEYRLVFSTSIVWLNF